MQFTTDRYVPMNVSKEADAEFMHLLEKEDPKRHANLIKSMRNDNPEMMDESQALTNFMLGLPTGRFHFEIVAGDPAPVSESPETPAKHKKARRHFHKCEYCQTRFLVQRSTRRFCSKTCTKRWDRANRASITA